ncbi:MAG TPA: hypothetical protein ENN29_05915 [Candidatus Hydrogenedentes bacterium]|nr:hypothetical protein [Candidatus Hydrogenedentota bacterium]
MRTANGPYTLIRGALLCLCLFFAGVSAAQPFEISLDTVLEHDDGAFLWFHPRAAAIPGAGKDGAPAVVMTLQKHLQVSDFYSGMYALYSDDLGKTWTGPVEIPELAWREGPDNTILAVCDVTPNYHPPTGKVLAMGAQLYYHPDGKLLEGIKRSDQTAYTVYDPDTGAWSGWKVLEMPDAPKFNFSRNACAQWLIEPAGTLLVPLYFGKDAKEDFSVTVARCSFDGETLRYIEHGTEMTVAGGRGLCEPSLARHYGRYFLTLRNDARGYVTSGRDGLTYDPIKPWQFDDGEELGSYNTQQHWLEHTDGLYLTYTRRGANNDHVFRHRAPLFIAQVALDTLQVIRATERVLIPERGATLGNFGASAVTQEESWVTVNEGIWNDDIRARGATGALYIARVQWTKPNDAIMYPAPTLPPRMTTIDLDVNETVEVPLIDGATATVTLLGVEERRDPIREVVRHAEAQVRVNGEVATLASGLYNLPVPVGGVRVDCPVTQGYNLNSGDDRWSLEKDVRLRLWPADGSYTEPDTFVYPVRQRWYASQTWFDNEPVDGGAEISKTVYYHSGIDIGGVDGRTEIIAATDALVVSARDETLPWFQCDTPMKPRYDVVYLYDARGWFYRYSHFARITDAIQPGVRITKGTLLGLLGKEGASGGWSHIHFEIKTRQPSGGWGTLAANALIREAYIREYNPDIIACARDRHLIMPGDTVTLDASRSWSRDSGDTITGTRPSPSISGGMSADNGVPGMACEWQFTDGSTATGAQVDRRYDNPGRYNEIVKVTDAAGRIDYDFAIVQVLNPERPNRYVPGLHAAYEPTLNIRPGDVITFSVRAFGFEGGEELWDFGDGSPEQRTQSSRDKHPHAPDGYAFIEHAYAAPGHYIVRVYREETNSIPAYAHLHVEVEGQHSM